MSQGRHARPVSRHRGRRLLGAALVVASGVFVAGAGLTGAVFSDSATIGANVFSSGRIDLASSATTLFTAANMVPGDVITQPLTLTNSGTAKLRYALQSRTTEDTLASTLVLTLQTRTASDPTCTAFDGVPIYRGPLGSTTGTRVFGDAAPAAQANDRLIAAGANEGWCAQVALPLSASNTLATKTTTATFTFDAEQTANNGPEQVDTPLPKMSTFTDDFQTGSSARWVDWVNKAPKVKVENGQFLIAPVQWYTSNDIVGTWDFANSSLAMKVAALPTGPAAADGEMAMYVHFNDGSDVGWIVASDGTLVTMVNDTYDTADDLLFKDFEYLRLRESAGTVYWEYSTDGHVWQTARTEASPDPVGEGVWAEIFAGDGQSNDPAQTGYFAVESVNGTW